MLALTSGMVLLSLVIYLPLFLFCAGLLLAALFLKDVPLAKQFRDEAGATEKADSVDTSASVM